MIENTSKIRISTVTPVYSGADYLETLLAQLDVLRTSWIQSNAPIELTEAIFVDDESIDNSFGILETLADKYPWMVLIRLSRNFGQHPATAAGILYSSGDWVVTLDEDLQHPPSLIESLLKKAVMESYDIVYANPLQAVHQNMLRDIGSRLYKQIIATLTGDKNIPFINSFRLVRGTVARAASSVCGHDTYLDIAMSWFSQRVGFIAVVLKDERHITSGKSGYNLRKLLSHARRMILSTHTKALRIAGLLGLVAFTISLTFGSYIFLKTLLSWGGTTVQGWSSLIVSILFMGSVGILLSSVILEYVSVILLHTQGKPTFFVVERGMDKELQKYFKD